MLFEPESIDLAQLASDLNRAFADSPPLGYLLGRTMLRDAVVRQLSCSELQAEELVDTMVSLGFLEYQGDPTAEVDELRPWSIGGDQGR